VNEFTKRQFLEIVMKTGLITVGVIAVILFVGWLGLRWQPTPFAPFPQTAGPLPITPLPDDLPAPVERFYRLAYGDELPLIETAVITGRGWIRPVGALTFPARFRFTHEAGQNYRHYIEATFFGLPILKVNEHFLDGRLVLLEAALTWYDDGSPWASFVVEELVYNADIADYIRAAGP
jgi:hypothetical protein